MRPPLCRQVERDLRHVVRDDLAGRDVDHRRHRDSLVVVGVASEVGLFQTLDAEHRITTGMIEVERPALLVMSRPGDRHGQHLLEPEQASDNDRPVGPRAGPAHDDAIAPRLDRIPVSPVRGDPRDDVARIAVVALARFDITTHASVMPAWCRWYYSRDRRAATVPRPASAARGTPAFGSRGS